jgi:hypothetical protein
MNLRNARGPCPAVALKVASLNPNSRLKSFAACHAVNADSKFPALPFAAAVAVPVPAELDAARLLRFFVNCSLPFCFEYLRRPGLRGAFPGPHTKLHERSDVPDRHAKPKEVDK